jgi:outer membrane protein, multidrug efflux system
LANFEYLLPGYKKQAQQAMNRLSVLTGQQPGTLDAMLGPSAPLPKVPVVVAIGVPSTLARRRPDIREAEARLHAATANVGVATASFYPDISLTGSFGLRALDASYLTNWASDFYAFGPSISLPIFQGGRLTASLRMARAQEAEAALAYRGRVLNALQEVEDALVAYRTDRAGRNKLMEAVKSGEVALYLARDRYTHGLADFLQVLDAERTLVGSRQQLVQADVMLTNDVVALYDALGGGWRQDAATSPGAGYRDDLSRHARGIGQRRRRGAALADQPDQGYTTLRFRRRKPGEHFATHAYPIRGLRWDRDRHRSDPTADVRADLGDRGGNGSLRRLGVS